MPRGAADRARRATPAAAMTPARRPVTTSMAASPIAGGRSLQFPRAGGDQFSIGRDARCDLAIDDMTVSRIHARLEQTRTAGCLRTCRPPTAPG